MLELDTEMQDVATRPRLVALIPAYNEERFIGSVVLKTRRYVDIVIVIDDGSSDATGEIATGAGALVLTHKKNQGKGAALNTGLHAVLQYQPTVVMIMDADGQHNPEEILQLAQPILSGQADITVGSRYLVDNPPVPRYRFWGHRLMNTITNLASGIPLTDSQSGFRAFSAKALEKMSFLSTGFSVESEMQFLVHDQQLRLVEVPITTNYQGVEKRSAFAQGVHVLNGILWLAGQFRPLLVFSLIGLLILSGGLVGVIWVVQLFPKDPQWAIFCALAALTSVLIGCMAFFTGFMLHSIRQMLLKFEKKRST